MERRSILFYPDYVDLLDGDVSAALMLSQIVYWYLPSKKTGLSKLRVLKDGKWWVAKSHPEWNHECGFSRRQTQRCLKVLEINGFIETTVCKFNGTPTVHLRLMAAKGKSMCPMAPTASDLHSSLAPKAHPGSVECSFMCNSLTLEEQSLTGTTTKKTTAIETSELKLAGSKQEEQGKNQIGEKVLEKVQTQEVTPDTEKAKTGIEANKTAFSPQSALALLWKSAVAASQPEEYQQQLTFKEMKQLKILADKLGPQIKEVIEYAVKNWWKFATDAKSSAGLKNCPSDPHVGYLLAHHAVAVNQMQLEVQKQSCNQIAKKNAAEELAEKEAQANEAKKAIQELKSKKSSPALLCLKKEQLAAYFDFLENPANEAWVDSVTEKYGEWRPDEKGIPCDIELKKAG